MRRTTSAAMSVLTLWGAVVLTNTAGASPQSPPRQTAWEEGAPSSLREVGLAGTLLYAQLDQETNLGITSQDFTDRNSLDNQLADDFVVPRGESWTLETVAVVGIGTLTRSDESVNLWIYPDARGAPGATPVLAALGLRPVAGRETGDFVIALPNALRLSAGRYWLSVQVKKSLLLGGQWFWKQRAVASGALSMWRNPNNGFGSGCVNWTATAACIPEAFPDLLFQLQGTKTIDRGAPSDSPPQALPVLQSPIGGVMVTSLRPTFTWAGVPGVTDYTLVLSESFQNASGSSSREIRRVGLAARDVCTPGTRGTVTCSFKPGFPSPGGADPQRFELRSNPLGPAAPPEPFTTFSAPPRGDDSFRSYQWRVEALGGSDRGNPRTSEPAHFQIAPLGTYPDVNGQTGRVCANVPNLCPGSDYCADPTLGYNGGFWSLYDDSFYRWGEIFDVPPSILKAIVWAETSTAIGPRKSNGRWYPPSRAYLYEARLDYRTQTGESSDSCVGACADFKITAGYSPTPTPYDRPVSIPSGFAHAPIWSFACVVGYTHDLYRITGCGFASDQEFINECNQPTEGGVGQTCRNNTRTTSRTAEYATVASYGLGQALFSSVWPTLRAIRAGTLPPPVNLYDPDFSIRTTAAVLGLEKRCFALQQGNSYVGAHNTPGEWFLPVKFYNGDGDRAEGYATTAVNRTCRTAPLSMLSDAPAAPQVESERQAMEALLNQLVGAGCSVTQPQFERALFNHFCCLGVSDACPAGFTPTCNGG